MRRLIPTLQLPRCRTLGSLLAVILLATVAFPAAAQKVSNPFANAKGYVNPEWAAKASAEPGGSVIANQPTAIWLDQIAAIAGANGAMGLQAHLDNALATGAGYIEFVIYDLPGRDCAALSSNGELGPTDIATYKSSYIDPIAALQTSSKYASLRIVNIIEPDSLPNLVTNASGQAGATSACATMLANGNYVAGVQYALSKLGNSSNIYNYIDIGHHAWLGWDTNFGPAATLIANTVKGATGGANTISGLIANTANYCATTEPNFTINDTVNGTSVRQSKWVDWNFYVDEQSFGVAFTKQVGSNLGRSDLGTLIDTSRNGWGGSARPTGPGPTTSVDAYVDGGRIDRRIHAGNWCNQVGAGIGARPTAAPAAGVHAYVWIKPPGESDGSDHVTTATRGLDGMCDPNYAGNARNGNNATGAMANSPIAGAWFSAQFQQLLANAYPPLSGGGGGGTTFALTVTKAGTGSGTVTASSGGLNCGTTCSASYASGTSVTLTATAATGSTFAGFSGACTGTSTCVLGMTAARSVTATFNTAGGGTTFALTVTKAGTGSGTVTASSGGLNCGTTCSASYASGTSVTLTATAATGSTFAGFSGACAGTSTCVLGMTTARSVTATFNTAGGGTTFALTVTKAGTGSGTVTASSGGLNCGTTCSATYASGTSVTLTATAATGSTFAGFSGACAGTSTCVLGMTAARSVTATFNTAGGGGGGTGSCTATFTASAWNTGFTGTVTVKAGSAAITGWTVTLSMGGNTVTQVWNATQSGSQFKNMSYNGALSAGGTTTFGFNGAFSGTFTAPTVASCTAP